MTVEPRSQDWRGLGPQPSRGCSQELGLRDSWPPGPAAREGTQSLPQVQPKWGEERGTLAPALSSPLAKAAESWLVREPGDYSWHASALRHREGCYLSIHGGIYRVFARPSALF